MIKNSKVFTRFFISCMITMILPLFLFSYIILTTTRGIKENAQEKTLLHLDSAKNEIDIKMEALYSNVISVSYNSTIQNVLNSEFTPDLLVDLWASFNDLSYIEQNSDSVYVYSENMDAIITSSGIYNLLDEIYGSVLEFGSLSFDEFYSTYLKGNFQNKIIAVTDVIVDSRRFKSIVYLQSIPLGTINPQLGNVLYFINNDAVINSFNKIPVDEGAWACIVSKDYEVITGVGEYPAFVGDLIDTIQTIEKNDTQDTYSSDEYLISYRKSDFNGWYYLSGTPESYIFNDYHTLRISIWLITILYLIASIPFAFFISKKNIKPLDDLINFFGIGTEEDQRNINQYQLLHEYVENLSKNNYELSTSLNDHTQIIEKTHISNLISGTYNTIEEIKDYMANSTIIQYESYTFAIIDFFPNMNVINTVLLDNLMLRRLQVNKILDDLNISNMIHSEINVNQIGLLFYSHDTSEECKYAIISKINKILDMVHTSIDKNIFVGIGTVCNDILQVSYSHIQAECAIRSAFKENKPLMHYDCIPKETVGYYFPDNLRTSLLKSITEGNLKQAQSTLKMLENKNFLSASTHVTSVEYLIDELSLVFIRLKDAGVINAIPTLHEDCDLYNKFTSYSDDLLSICTKNTNITTGEKNRLDKDFLEYIDTHYSDRNLCLSMIATNFNLTEAYLSHLFKKNLNINFSNFLEQKRIRKAVEILKEGTASIENIALRVGYNSPHAFRRAFKKVTGISPRDIKTSHTMPKM